tara:strand:- start:406 stop:1491 length:1086 start_codon:yes stop_codon:yes gene_type:complete
MSKNKFKLPKKSIKFLSDYINNPSPTGNESAGQKLWLNRIKPYIDTYRVDNYGSVVGVINPKAKFKVVIEAHADEICWSVKYITPDGYIHVTRNGGTDHQIAPSMRVNLHGDKGIIKGVFGHPAIHTRRGKDTKIEVSTITVDVGAKDAEEIYNMGIKVGHMITYVDGFDILNKDSFIGRALDNRIGGFMISEVARIIHEENIVLPFGLYIVNAVQEEIGLKGGKMMADSIKPDVAIVTDVCHDTTTPGISKAIEGFTKCGEGPVLSMGPAVQNNLFKLIINTAEKNNIPYQRLSASGATGTDTDAFAYSNGGVTSALISLPLKYMHTTVETVNKKDVENVIKLILNTLKKIKNNHNFKEL